MAQIIVYSTLLKMSYWCYDKELVFDAIPGKTVQNITIDLPTLAATHPFIDFGAIFASFPLQRHDQNYVLYKIQYQCNTFNLKQSFE